MEIDVISCRWTAFGRSSEKRQDLRLISCVCNALGRTTNSHASSQPGKHIDKGSVIHLIKLSYFLISFIRFAAHE